MVLEVSGTISVTFRVENAADLRRIMAVCEEFDSASMLLLPTAKVSNTKRPPARSQEESFERILTLLKSTLPNDGFTISDATALVSQKLQYGNTSTRNAIHWGRNKGHLIKKGKAYYFTEFIQERIAAKMKEIASDNTSDALQPIPSMQVTQAMPSTVSSSEMKDS